MLKLPRPSGNVWSLRSKPSTLSTRCSSTTSSSTHGKPRRSPLHNLISPDVCLRFYNTTYTVFAASIILVYVTQEATESELGPLLKLVSMAVEILETMDECVVAIKAAQLLRRASEKAGKKFSAAESSTAADVGEMHAATSHENDAMLHLNQYWGPLSFAGGEMDMDFGLHFGDLDGAGSLLMTLAEQSPV